ncbi:MAG: hypothetical protein JSW11_13455 [Candidatus Heimdallarchaeota archaeon]|nr:MAG: hypothetical protein JSW11_13455 [Candidatus Heimdallarchaeota archaeon]
MINDVPQGRDSLKRIIQTVIDYLPEIIKNYPPKDQLLLNDFLSVLQHYSEADNQRERLSKRFELYRSKNYLTDLYFQLPFLWFAHDYFANANLILNLAEFHGTRFYEYLARSLRRNPDVQGVFPLLRQMTPLSDPKWEQLQIIQARIKIQLTDEQLQIIKESYTALRELGIQGLNSRVLYNFVKKSDISLNTKSLSKFFTLLDSQWNIWFYPPAFGLKQLYFNFKLTKTSLNEIFDFKDSFNTTLCNSRVYRSRNFPNQFSGYLEIPHEGLNDLVDYIQNYADQGNLKIFELSEVTDLRVSASFNLYHSGVGWTEILPGGIKRSILPLKSNHPRKLLNEKPFFLSPAFNHEWNFLQSPDPRRSIRIFCQYKPQIYNFNALQFGSASNQRVFMEDFGLIKYFHRKMVCTNLIFMANLIYNFSPDFYEIVMPIIPIERLNLILAWLPYSRILFTTKKIHLWTFLPTQILEWMKKEFSSWEFRLCISHHYSPEPDPSWFDFDSLKWLLPRILS